ncbi:hypothetical protein B0H16DRAFT_1565250 [Mycena metata]|uniref:Ubiquitin 3 binding protein But2 C-terminal domain-containing protein n=1 Tax=Mycena metata TaxID=1033252 RepID=A0AAD7IEI1_9AGAR|nr:hypothetical protein B0H16DRAFT_1565250 [Mycena metata]
MAEYTRLTSASPDDDEMQTKSQPTVTDEISPRYVLLFSVLMALMAISAAAAFHMNVLSATWKEPQALLRPKDIEDTFRMAQPSPNLDQGHATMRKMKFKFPRMVFPMFIVRANAAAPDTVYQSGPSVVLSQSDSMIYHWRTNSSWPKCYLAGWVSASKDLIAGHKSYTSEGDMTAIEMWNLSTPANPQVLKTMSWNTRPQRLSLLGTVNFTSRETQARLGYLDAQEIKAPTPRVDCLGDTEITVEVVCKGCRLEFEQVFSMPPLGFELMQLA